MSRLTAPYTKSVHYPSNSSSFRRYNGMFFRTKESRKNRQTVKATQLPSRRADQALNHSTQLPHQAAPTPPPLRHRRRLTRRPAERVRTPPDVRPDETSTTRRRRRSRRHSCRAPAATLCRAVFGPSATPCRRCARL